MISCVLIGDCVEFGCFTLWFVVLVVYGLLGCCWWLVVCYLGGLLVGLLVCCLRGRLLSLSLWFGLCTWWFLFL